MFLCGRLGATVSTSGALPISKRRLSSAGGSPPAFSRIPGPFGATSIRSAEMPRKRTMSVFDASDTVRIRLERRAASGIAAFRPSASSPESGWRWWITSWIVVTCGTGVTAGAVLKRLCSRSGAESRIARGRSVCSASTRRTLLVGSNRSGTTSTPSPHSSLTAAPPTNKVISRPGSASRSAGSNRRA